MTIGKKLHQTWQTRWGGSVLKKTLNVHMVYSKMVQFLKSNCCVCVCVGGCGGVWGWEGVLFCCCSLLLLFQFANLNDPWNLSWTFYTDNIRTYRYPTQTINTRAFSILHLGMNESFYDLSMLLKLYNHPFTWRCKFPKCLRLWVCCQQPGGVQLGEHANDKLQQI